MQTNMKINEKSLISYSISREHIDKEGYLLKRGEGNKTFQQRWFVLKGNLLFYFEKQGDKEPIGVILLEGCITELAESIEHHLFRIVFQTPGLRSYDLAAENHTELEAWMKCISRASYDYLRLMVAELQQHLQELEESKKQDEAIVSPLTWNLKGSPTKRENPFNKVTSERSYSDMWDQHDAATTKSSLSSLSNSNTGSTTGLNSILPASIPFRKAPPPPTVSRPQPPRREKKKKFSEMHSFYGLAIYKDRQKYFPNKETKLIDL